MVTLSIIFKVGNASKGADNLSTAWALILSLFFLVLQAINPVSQLFEKVALGKLSIRHGKKACFNDRI